MKKRHTLFDIDLERKTALCAVCGHTEIYLTKPRKRVEPKAICMTRAREIQGAYEERKKLRHAERRAQLDWKSRHVLSEKDTEMLRAICSICGPTEIIKITTRGYARYVCANNYRKYLREYQRARYTGRPTNPHALSEIDEENQTATCAKCGRVKIHISVGKRKTTRRCINAVSRKQT